MWLVLEFEQHQGRVLHGSPLAHRPILVRDRSRNNWQLPLARCRLLVNCHYLRAQHDSSPVRRSVRDPRPAADVGLS